jgi:hypothetical protein
MTVKGSWQRPVDKEKFSKNFDKIFGTKQEKINDKADVRKLEATEKTKQ